MTSDNHFRQAMPVCIIFDVLFTKLKVRFYCENEVFLPLFFTQMILQFPYFYFTYLFRKRNAGKGRFCNFFYLHADEQGKTRLRFCLQTSFPPWPRGKGNCLPD